MKIKGIITQAVANTTIQATISTLLTVSGKTGWRIDTFKAFFLTGGFPITDSAVELSLQTETAVQLHGSADLIARCRWQVKAMAAGAAGGLIIPYVQTEDNLDRVTVQPNLVLALASTALSSVASVGYEISYEPVKLSDLDVMTLMQGGV